MTQIKVPPRRRRLFEIRTFENTRVTTNERGMFALRTPQRSPGCEPATGAIRAVSDLLGRAVLVLTTLMLFTFVTGVASQAYPSETNPTAPQIAQRAPQVAKQHAVSNRAAAAPLVVKFLIKSTACCGGSGHCHGRVCAGSCCPACTAGVIVPGWTIARDLALPFDFRPLRPPMPPTDDTPFRPPRIVL